MRVAWVLSITCAVLLLPATGACGDNGDETTGTDVEAKQFLEELDALNVEFATRNGDIREAYPQAYTGDLEQLKDAYPAYVDLFDDISASMAKLNPPDDLNSAHDRLLDSNSAIGAANHERLTLVQEATSQVDVDAIFAADAEYDTAVQEGIDVCKEFGREAVAVGVEWHSDCSG
jgi:hypothetical protein